MFKWQYSRYATKNEQSSRKNLSFLVQLWGWKMMRRSKLRKMLRRKQPRLTYKQWLVSFVAPSPSSSFDVKLLEYW